MYRRVLHEQLKFDDDYLDSETRAFLRGVRLVFESTWFEADVSFTATSKGSCLSDDRCSR